MKVFKLYVCYFCIYDNSKKTQFNYYGNQSILNIFKSLFQFV